ncbi:hypothetical protein TURU_099360 [Turdus rufiventris]|nr:hypothetical protein TURU_099360 [Turdus rufiventris]
MELYIIQLAGVHNWCSPGLSIGPSLVKYLYQLSGLGDQVNPRQFANETRLYGSIGMMEKRKALKRDQNRMDCWAKAGCMRFIKANFWILHLGRNNSMQSYQTVGRVVTIVESFPEEKDWVVLAGNWLNMSQQWLARVAKKANGILTFTSNSVVSRIRAVIFLL